MASTVPAYNHWSQLYILTQEGRDALAGERLLDNQNGPAHHGNTAIPVLQQCMASSQVCVMCNVCFNQIKAVVSAEHAILASTHMQQSKAAGSPRPWL